MTLAQAYSLRASLSTVPEIGSSFWAKLRQVDFERRLALVLTVSAIVAGLATYWTVPTSLP